MKILQTQTFMPVIPLMNAALKVHAQLCSTFPSNDCELDPGHPGEKHFPVSCAWFWAEERSPGDCGALNGDRAHQCVGLPRGGAATPSPAGRSTTPGLCLLSSSIPPDSTLFIWANAGVCLEAGASIEPCPDSLGPTLEASYRLFHLNPKLPT